MPDLSFDPSEVQFQNRQTLNNSYRFGDQNYAREELLAELRACFWPPSVEFCTTPGQHASYVSPWIKALSDDRNEIFRAAYDASRASAFLLALERDKSLANLRLLRPKPRRQRWSRKPLESTRILKPSRI